MNISKKHIIKSNFIVWTNFSIYLHDNFILILIILFLTILLLIIFIVLKNLKISENNHYLNDCNLSDLLIKLINEYYNSDHEINGLNMKFLFNKNFMDNQHINDCLNYIKLKINEYKKYFGISYKFFDDTPNINFLNIEYNSYRTLLFVIQQYNSSIIFQEKQNSLFFKSKKQVFNHLNKLMNIYNTINNCNKLKILRIFESDFNYNDFKLFLVFSIFLYSLHLKL